MTAQRKRFSVAGGTLPSAEELPDATTPVRQDAQAPVHQEVPAPVRKDAVTPVRQEVQASKTAGPARSAFTWRLTTERAVALDDMVMRLKLQLGRPRLDRAEMLSALVDVASENPAIFSALEARLADLTP